MAETTCTFQIKNNQLTAVSGADTGTYLINNNETTIKISSKEYKFNPFSKTPNGSGDSYLDMVTNSLIQTKTTTS